MENVVTQDFLPFEFDGWDQQDVQAFTYYDVTFTREWGSNKHKYYFEKGQKIPCLTVDFEKGTLRIHQEGDNTGEQDEEYNIFLGLE